MRMARRLAVNSAAVGEYTVHYSARDFYRSGNTTTRLYLQSSPSAYAAGGASADRYGSHYTFDLDHINADRVTAITLYVQRIVGYSNITYTVPFYRSVLSSAIPSGVLQLGYSIFTTNRVESTWEGASTDVGGEYRSYTIDPAQFANLRDYGLALAWWTDVRAISIDDVYVVITL